MERFKQKLQAAAIPFRENEPLAAHCTFKIGGPAQLFVMPENEQQLCSAVALCKEHHVESGRDCCIAISPFFCRDLLAYPQVPHLHGNEKPLAQCQDRRFLWGILTSAVLSSLPNGSLPSFTYGRASDALTFSVLLRIPRLRPPSLPSNIGELGQRKNKQGAETHVFVLAGAGRFSTTID